MSKQNVSTRSHSDTVCNVIKTAFTELPCLYADSPRENTQESHCLVICRTVHCPRVTRTFSKTPLTAATVTVLVVVVVEYTVPESH